MTIGGADAESARRIRVLASLRVPTRHAWERLDAAPGAVRYGVKMGVGQDEILALAGGRRTPRDLAFALGRGVYATILQLARMRAAGLLVSSSQLTSRAAARQARHPAEDEPEPAGRLPRARALLKRSGLSVRSADPHAPRGLLRPRPGQGPARGSTGDRRRAAGQHASKTGSRE